MTRSDLMKWIACGLVALCGFALLRWGPGSAVPSPRIDGAHPASRIEAGQRAEAREIGGRGAAIASPARAQP